MQNQDRANIQLIKELLQKHLKRELTPEEAEQLIDLMKNKSCVEEVDEIMRDRWGLDVRNKSTSGLTWSEILAETNKHISKSQVRKIPNAARIMRYVGIAASLALMVILTTWEMWNSEQEYLIYTTKYGETKNIILNDGSKVVLNANSTLTWKKHWKSDTVRIARLKGEAFFEVSKVEFSDIGKDVPQGFRRGLPFQVRTSDLVIDVLGTTFNVVDRRDETHVYLKEGSIKLDLLYSTSLEQTEDGLESGTPANKIVEEKNSILMKPGDLVEFSAKTQKLEKIHFGISESMTEWREGTLAYHDMNFAKMLEHLEDVYGKHFIVRDSSLFDTKVTIGLPFEDWKTVKNLMELFLQIELTAKGSDQIYIYKK